MIRVDAVGLATEPIDMRAGTETALARVVVVYGAALPNCAYLVTNHRANRMKVLGHDGAGIWLTARQRSRLWIAAHHLGSADTLPRCWCRAYGQQSGRQPDRPWAPGRSNWLFAGSLRSGKRAAAIMSLTSLHA